MYLQKNTVAVLKRVKHKVVLYRGGIANTMLEPSVFHMFICFKYKEISITRTAKCTD